MRCFVCVTATVVVAASTGLAACHHAPPAEAAAPVAAQGPNADSARMARAREDAAARAAAARRDSLARAAARADSLRRAADAMRAAEAAARTDLVAAIHFDFDRAEILAGDRSTLDRKATILEANSGIQIRVDGNADERGSSRYNMGLGMRRAGEARRYLTDHGVAANRIETVSYGKERPLCTEHDESCWSQNRRDGFTITAGGDRIVAGR